MTYVDHNVEIILCEGKNDEVFLSRILVKNYSIHDYSRKDRIVRRIYDRYHKDVFFIIREEGKQRLEKNLRTLISKLRSINRDIEIFVLVDSNNSPTTSYRSKLYNDIKAYTNNKRRFPRPPSLSFEDKDPFYGTIKVTYISHKTVIVHIFVIPHSLEYWIHEKRLNTIGKLKHVNWFTSLCRVLGKLGLINRNLDENTVLTG